MILTEQQLKQIFPKAPLDKIKLYAPILLVTCTQMGFNTPKRVAALLGQIAVESGELKYDKELPSKWNKKNPNDPNEPVGTLYEGRKTLGNIIAGDGPKYIGRGLLQLTGRANYLDFGRKIGADLINNPDLACDPTIAVKIACQFFKDRKLDEAADRWDLATITKRVNGTAMLHHDKRVAYSEKALKILEG